MHRHHSAFSMLPLRILINSVLLIGSRLCCCSVASTIQSQVPHYNTASCCAEPCCVCAVNPPSGPSVHHWQFRHGWLPQNAEPLLFLFEGQEEEWLWAYFGAITLLPSGYKYWPASALFSTAGPVRGRPTQGPARWHLYTANTVTPATLIARNACMTRFAQWGCHPGALPFKLHGVPCT